MSSTAPAAAVHRVYRKVTAKNAKCDICNTRNLGVMQKCVTCGVTTCENCKATGRYDSKHNLTGLDLDWAKPNTNGKGVRASVRDNKTILLVNSSDDDDGGLLVPQTPRAPRAPGTSSREGLIREPATMTAACNLQRAREDQANQRQSGLGDGPDFHFTTQPQDQGYSSAHDLQPKPGPIVIGDDDDLMEILTPPSLGQFTGTIHDVKANNKQHLRDEKEVLASEVRRLRDKERSHANEDCRLREQLQQQTHQAEEARVAYHREVASHKQTINELSELRKNYDDCREQFNKLSSETMPSHGKTALSPPCATAKPEDAQPMLSSATSSAPLTDTAGYGTRAEAVSVRFSDIPAVKEARRSQINAGIFPRDGMVTALPARIARNPFQAKRRKLVHTSSDADFQGHASRVSAIEDKDTSMEDGDSDETISLASASTTKETPNTTKGQAGRTMESVGTQTRLSAATYVDRSMPIGKDLDAKVLQAVFGRSRGRAALLKIPGRGDEVEEQVLFSVKRKWERSLSFNKVKVAEGGLAALQMLETATTLGCLSRGMAFPPNVDAYIQGIRGALLHEHGDKTGAIAN